MLVKGVKRRLSIGRYRFVSKQTPPATSVTTAIAAGTVASAPSAGYKITIQPRQAIWIRRYITTVVDAAGGFNHLYACGGEFEYQKSPFTLAAGFIGYPLIEMSINGAAGTPFGQVLTDTGVVFCLVDDWYEYDDTIGNPTVIQLQSFWKILNSTAGALSAIVAEQLTYDLYEGGIND